MHSIAAGILLNKSEIHFFNDIAYWHVPFTHCPTSEKTRLALRCHCNPKDNFDWKGYSCTLLSCLISMPYLAVWLRRHWLTTSTGTSKYFDVNGLEKPGGYENQQD